jgi:predicted nucleic acid-binding protein
VSRYFFPDNTVLINFTMLERRDLLEWFVQGAGAWTLSIARECERSAQVENLGAMSEWHEVFGTPLSPSPAELVDAHAIADRMRSPGENSPAQHMGEAETIAIIVRRQLSAIFLTDDHAAARAAVVEPLVKGVASTTKVLAMAEVAGKIEHVDARLALAGLLNARRVMGNPPLISEYDSYVAELKRLASRS